MERIEAEKILKSTFKFSQFYDNQWKTIEKLLHGEKVLLIEKTGFGKSLCFQFPALILPGVTVIFTPLIALMRDQVNKLNTLGIQAKCIHYGQTKTENNRILKEAIQGKLKILYIAPERQESTLWNKAIEKMNLAMLVVDEAHCISVWGHDFRPAFKRIVNLVKKMPKGFPILATTATATKDVETDIANQIGKKLTIIRGDLLRSNLKLFVIKVNSEEEKMIWLGKSIEKLPGYGLLYTGTRVDTDIYAKWFEYLGISAIAYNAGLEQETRLMIENGLMHNKWKCIISTNALGMGVDKPDIRFIIHTQVPQSPIHYYQEIGRAGRDGFPAVIILFYNQKKDKDLPLSFVEGGRPSQEKYKKVIECIKSGITSRYEIIKRINIKTNQFDVIRNDLLEQEIISENLVKSTKRYTYNEKSKPLDTTSFQEFRDTKFDELYKMLGYINTTESRMKYLCEYLGDNTEYEFKNCDNTDEIKLRLTLLPEWEEKLQNFHESNYPKLEFRTKDSNLVNGIATSYYGISRIGNTIHQCKYEKRKEFPELLLKLTIKAFRHNFAQIQFDLLLYVPPTRSGVIVQNFAIRLAEKLKIPISHNLIKIKFTKQQKNNESMITKRINVKNAFDYKQIEEIKDKNILLVDDICDSGATIMEIGNLLTKLGAKLIAPITIAKTVGGDLM